MKTLVWLLFFLTSASAFAEINSAQHPGATDHLIVVVGASGSEEYADPFRKAADQWGALADKSHWRWALIGPRSTQNHDSVAMDQSDQTDSSKHESQELKTCREQLRSVLEEWIASKDLKRLWLVMIGHGTSTNGVTKFNLDGPDVTAEDLKGWLGNSAQEQVVVACFSSSAPFLTELAGENRILVTATRSGSEMNYSRFGGFFAEGLQSLTSDLDHDREISLLEAFLAASKSTSRFYRDESRLVTEHSLIDDNGDRLGTSAEFFQGVVPIKSAKDQSPIDGKQALRIILFSSPDAIQLTDDQEEARKRIEESIDRIKANRGKISADEYYRELELEFVQLAKIYSRSEEVETVERPNETETDGTTRAIDASELDIQSTD